MKYSPILIFILMLGLLPGCEKVLIDDGGSRDPHDNFDFLWKTLDEKYVFFDYKEIDWQAMRAEYRPKIHEKMGNLALFETMADMLYTFRDGHVNLYSPFDASRNWTWFLDQPRNFNSAIIRQNYLGNDAVKAGPLRAKILGGSVGYIYYPSFADDLQEGSLDSLIQSFSSLRGMVVDVRSNSGGNSRNAEMLASRFADQKRLVSKHLYKKGPEHNDFYPPREVFLEPGGPNQFTKPVIVLMNRHSYSAANHFILHMKALPHVVLMGDDSGGGGGIPLEKEMPNGWILRYSATVTLSPDGQNVEHGISAHIKMDLERESELQGRDNILDTAVQMLSKQ